MLDVARESQAGVCVMHMQGTPQTMQDNPTYDDVVEEVFDYLRDRRDWLVAAGDRRARGSPSTRASASAKRTSTI